MITIIFEAHGTTYDNEAHLASGHNDVELSPLGEQQSREMGERYKSDHFDAVFCSDLQRAYKSAELAFGDKFPIIKDARLRECDYGDLTQKPSELVDVEKPKRLHEPFPNGESYEQTNARMLSFLQDLMRDYNGKRVMVIGHRATQYALDHFINYVPMETLVSTHFKWQPGWTYELHRLPRPYVLEEYDPEWPAMFQAYADKLAPILGDNALSIEHSGSTSIPGMVAKPQIDIVAVVKDLDKVTEKYEEFKAAGFTPRGRDYVGIGDEYFTVDSPDGRRLASIHIFPEGSQHVEDQRVFREYLTQNKEDRDLYIATKRKLYGQFSQNFAGYDQGKKETIDAVMARAKEWAKNK